MNDKSNHSPTGDVLQPHVGPFMAELRAAGYAATTLGTKRVTLERFVRWRHDRKSPSWDLTESEICEFLAKVPQGISDLVASGPFSEATLADKFWGEWLAVAQSKSDYLRAIEQAGFQEVTVEGESAFSMAENDERLKGSIVSIGLSARKK